MSRAPVDTGTNRIGANIRSSRHNGPRGSACSSGILGEQLKRKKKKKRKKEEVEYDYNDDDQSKIDIIPIFCAVTIASILGGPVCLVANLKLGLFAAIGGGIMGYTTGRMFSDHGHVHRTM